MTTNNFKFSDSNVYNLWGNADAMFDASFDDCTGMMKRINERLAFQSVRHYIFQMNAVATTYGDGINPDCLYQLADAIDEIKNLEPGESIYLIWSPRRVDYSKDIDEFNEEIRIHGGNVAEWNLRANCAYRIKRTPKRWQIYHLKPISE